MHIGWREDKRRINLRKHGFGFVDAAELFTGATVTIEDDRFDYGEQRWLTFGLLRGRVVVVAYVERGVQLHLISLRKAEKHEAIAFFQQIGD